MDQEIHEFFLQEKNGNWGKLDFNGRDVEKTMGIEALKDELVLQSCDIRNGEYLPKSCENDHATSGLASPNVQ